MSGAQITTETIGLKRTLRFWDLVLFGIVLVQPTAPMPVFGVLYQESRGHVVLVILLAMIAMLFTSVSYGRMARVYPHGGSAFLYVGKEIHPSLGYMTGWCLVMDYVLNPLNCNGVETSARINAGMAAALGIVIVLVLFAAVRWLFHQPPGDAAAWIHPF